METYIPQDDKFEGVACMTPFLRKALCDSPFQDADDTTGMYLMLDDSKEVGRR